MKRTLALICLLFATGCQATQPPPPPPAPPAPKPTATADKNGYYTTKGGVRYLILREAYGVQATPGKTLRVNYLGTLQNGQTFDSTYERKEPFEFMMGNGQVIQGWEEGMEGMRVGEKRKLIVPPDLAYGSGGYKGVIPPNATLTFSVELLDVR